MARIVAGIIAPLAPPNLQEVFKTYAFGPFRLDPSLRVLALRGEPLPLGPRVVATLAALVERPGQIVTKDEILDRVWPHEDVGESCVAQAVYELRKVFRAHALGDAIATVPRRGYRFTTPVELVETILPTIPIRPRVAAAARSSSQRWLRIAFAAVLAMALAVGLPTARALPQPVPLSTRGAELYRLARYHWNLRTWADLAKSESLFEAVVRSDPRSALGYVGLADAELMIADYGQLYSRKPGPAFARARRNVAAALRLEPGSAAAHTTLAMMLALADRNDRAADGQFRRAIALDPGYPIAHLWYGTLLFNHGRIAEAERELRAAVQLDPVSPASGAWLGEASYYDRRYADAIVYERLALDLDPHRDGALRTLGLAYEMAGDLPRAIAAFERIPAGRSEATAAPALLAEAYARAGRMSAARASLREALRRAPRDDDTAFAMLALGKRTQGLKILNAMRRNGDEGAGAMQDPRVDPFRAALRGPARPSHPTG